MDWGTVLGVFGIGAIFKTLIDAWISNKKERSKMKFSEKREAYFGLLEALHNAAVSPSDKNSKNFALWQTKVYIFGSEEASKAVQGIIDTNDGPRDAREAKFNDLLIAIRKDLTP
jgi:hypothetical protein